MKEFQIPFQYRSTYIQRIKEIRESSDKRKKDFSPSKLDLGKVEFLIARHFGFCFGVQNAVERAYQIIDDHPGKNIYLLSEMIHNPEVNQDLEDKGLQFIQNTDGSQRIPWEDLKEEDVVIIPAFGTTKEIEQLLEKKHLLVQRFDTTCPFVTRVWNKGEELAKQGYTIIIHGNFHHEETRATKSQIERFGKTMVVQNMKEVNMLLNFMGNERADDRDWNVFFRWLGSDNLSFREDFERIAVVNQTTMLASETEVITKILKDKQLERFGSENIDFHFGSTRDTLCYATNDNQSATNELIEHQPDLAIIVGGHNSSNTGHLAEILESKCPTYFITSEQDILDENVIRHYDIHKESIIQTSDFIPNRPKPKIALTSGASCPDAIMESVMLKLLSIITENADIDGAIDQMEKEINGL